MKTLTLAAAALALMAVADVSPTMAQERQPADGSTRPGMASRVESGSTNATTMAPHYEYRYGYDRHAHWRGQWVLIR